MAASSALWKKYCDEFSYYPQVGVTLDSSRMFLPAGFPASISGKVEKMFREMSELEKGALANPDENRMVGHYWLRTPELAPLPELRDAILSTCRSVKEFAAAIHQGTIHPPKAPKFTNVLLIGIGGSALGPQLLADALTTPQAPLRAFFMENTDPDGIFRILNQIGTELDRTLVIVSSKSGSTVETQNGALEVKQAYRRAGLRFGDYAVAVTAGGSIVEQEAKNDRWLQVFMMWDWVGGRTSVFSAVGLLLIALVGAPIDEFLEGGRAMDEITRQPDAQRNPAARLALAWYAAGEGRGAKDMVVLPYKDRLSLFGKYLQQLIMESLGKELDRDGQTVNQGIAVYGNKGSTDQHAFVQQLRDGLHNFFVTFIDVLSDYYAYGGKPAEPLEVKPAVTVGDYLIGFCMGTREALFEKGRSSLTITVDELSPKTLGALIALYDRAVGFYASLVNINAYHQPGVQAGKKAAEKVIALQQKILSALAAPNAVGQVYGVEQIAALAGAPEEAEAVYKIMEHLAMNGRAGVSRSGGRHPLEAKYLLKR